MKRRHFFQLIAGAAMLPVLPRFAKAAPMIWADGVHCDSAGLQAMIDGLPVEFADPSLAAKIGWFGDVLDFGEVPMRLTKGVVLGKSFSGKTLTKFDIEAEGLDGPVIKVGTNEMVTNVTISNGRIAAVRLPPSAYVVQFGSTA